MLKAQLIQEYLAGPALARDAVAGMTPEQARARSSKPDQTGFPASSPASFSATCCFLPRSHYHGWPTSWHGDGTVCCSLLPPFLGIPRSKALS